MEIIPIVGMLSVFVVLPSLTFAFISGLTKRRSEIKKLELEKEILELENHKMERKIELLRLENQKLDRMIED